MFNLEQIMCIEDKVINKLIYPMYVLKELKQGRSGDVELALECLCELERWVRSLRVEKNN